MASLGSAIGRNAVLAFCAELLLCVLVFAKSASPGGPAGGSSSVPSAPQSGAGSTQPNIAAPPGDGGLLRLSLEDLREPALPSGSWFTDPVCSRYRTGFARTGSLPPVRVVSFLRSGDEWAHYLLEAASGLAVCGGFASTETEAVPPSELGLMSAGEIMQVLKMMRGSDPAPSNMAFVGKLMPSHMRNCIAFKTHEVSPPWRNTKDLDYGYSLRAILLVRDPFTALVSVNHFQQQHPLINSSRAEDFTTHASSWETFVRERTEQWSRLHEDWATDPADTLLMPYELLERQTQTQLDAMLTFLGVAPEPARLRCALRHAGGHLKGRRQAAADRAVYGSDIRLMVWTYIHRLHKLLQSRGYAGLPLELYSFADENEFLPWSNTLDWRANVTV